MNYELRAAAERLRWLYSGDMSYYETYGGEECVHQHRDERKLIDAYLAEHPADDAEPVTVEWLERVGFVNSWSVGLMSKRRCLGRPPLWYHPQCADLAPLWTLGTTEDGEWDQWFRLHAMNTRGDVRRICAALGIQLAEGEG